jgi:hypothetical protein
MGKGLVSADSSCIFIVESVAEVTFSEERLEILNIILTALVPHQSCRFCTKFMNNWELVWLVFLF